MQRLTAAMLTTAPGDTRKKKTKPPSDDPKGTTLITRYGMLGAVTVRFLDVVANFANQCKSIVSNLQLPDHCLAAKPRGLRRRCN